MHRTKFLVTCLVFQSTRPRGARLSYIVASATEPDVSIHAPARGATHGCGRIHRRKICFNPRAREGRDKSFILLGDKANGFNPRAREGRDQMILSPT